QPSNQGDSPMKYDQNARRNQSSSAAAGAMRAWPSGYRWVFDGGKLRPDAPGGRGGADDVSRKRWRRGTFPHRGDWVWIVGGAAEPGDFEQGRRGAAKFRRLRADTDARDAESRGAFGQE